MTSEWRPLPTSSESGGTPLLAKCAFSADGYSVHVTDLSNLWSESLQKEAIIERAHRSRCPIDPDDGDSQFKKLLEKIEAAFRGDRGTELTIARRDARGELAISTTSPLPKPLHPLQWSMHLPKLLESSIRDQVVLPLMSIAFIQKQQIEELMSLLREKDNAIGKMVDKVESIGIDLSNIFPQAGAAKFSKKKSQREQVLKQVRGLAPFDREAWAAQSESALESSPLFTDVVRTAFTGIGTTKVQSVLHSVLSDDSSHLSDGKRNAALTQRTRDDAGGPSRQESQLDEFQHQLTPPELKKSEVADKSDGNHGGTDMDTDRLPKVKTEEIDDDETTEDEADAESRETDLNQREKPSPRPTRSIESSERLSAPPVPIDSDPKPAASPRKLGLIGKSKQKPQMAEPSRPLTAGGALNAGEMSEETTAPELRSPEKEAVTTTPQQTPRKLGKIGGRRAKQDDQNVASTNPVASKGSNKRESTPNTSEPSILEGDAKHATEPKAEVQEHEKEDNGSKEPPESPVEESAEAKADRKRIELKREMEEKSRAAPKKKRKF